MTDRTRSHLEGLADSSLSNLRDRARRHNDTLVMRAVQAEQKRRHDLKEPADD